MKLGSLFSGYGGLDQAVHAAFGDITTAWVSDFDTGPNKILAHRYPNVPNIGDITAIDWTTVEPVDIIAGGFPCQDVSTAGRRAGMAEGTRSNLWGAMRTAIEIVRPRYVVAENVRGLLSATANSVSDMESGGGPLGDGGADNLRALGRVLGDLADLGYDAGWRGLRASDVGAPHGRFRVFIVAEDSLRGGSGGWTGVASDSTSERADPGSNSPGQREVALLPTPRATRGGSHTETAQLLPTPDAYAGNRGGSQHPEKRRAGGHTVSLQDVTEHVLLPTPTAERPDGRKSEAFSKGRGTFYNIVENDMWGTYAPAIERWEHVTGRPAPAPTEPNGKNRPRLSARFVEFMMGLPDGWVTDTPGISRNEALRALGNGVVPQQGAVAIRHLLDLMEGQTE